MVWPLPSEVTITLVFVECAAANSNANPGEHISNKLRPTTNIISENLILTNLRIRKSRVCTVVHYAALKAIRAVYGIWQRPSVNRKRLKILSRVRVYTGSSFLRATRSIERILATATCLAGWLAGCPSQPGIVSKRLNLS